MNILFAIWMYQACVIAPQLQMHVTQEDGNRYLKYFEAGDTPSQALQEDKAEQEFFADE